MEASVSHPLFPSPSPWFYWAPRFLESACLQTGKLNSGFREAKSIKQRDEGKEQGRSNCKELTLAMKEAANASLLQAGGQSRLARFCSRQSQKAYRRAKGGSSSSLKAQAEPFLDSTVKHTDSRQPLLQFFTLLRPFRKGIIPPPTLGRKICWTPSTNLNVNLIHRHPQKDI